MTGTINLSKIQKEQINSLWNNDNQHFILFEFRNYKIIRINHTKKKKKYAYLLTNSYSNMYYINKYDCFPDALDKYNKYKGGVDLCNKLNTTYRYNHKLLKWWKSVFIQILEISISNAYLLYKYNSNKLSQKDFRLEIVK